MFVKGQKFYNIFSLPSVKVLCLTKSVIPQYLHVVEHGLDGLLRPGQLALDLVAVVLGVLGMKVVYPLGLVLDPGLDVVQLAVGHLGLLVDLFGEPLELLEAGDLLVDELVALLVFSRLVNTLVGAVFKSAVVVFKYHKCL